MKNFEIFSQTNDGNLISRNLKYILLIILFSLITHSNAERINILMSNVTTQKEDAYICTSYKLSEYQQYITNVEPLATAAIAHHIFAFGCEKPATESKSWNCENIVCQGPKTILYAWGRNAPSLELPNNVAFKVGPRTPYKYIVVNIHYLIKVQNDQSGLGITFTERAPKYQAGIMLMVANYIGIPPRTKQYSTKFSCKYSGKLLKMFAYRVHAHSHGDVNAAYRVRHNEWTKLAQGDPQWPQAFYPTDETFDIQDGDALLGICTYHNDENKMIYAGSTHNDEMCNIYLMYYTEDTTNVQDTCSGSTYPQLETIIPPEAQVKPQPPSNFHQLDETIDQFLSHHDMKVSRYTKLDDWYDQKSVNFGQIGGIAIDQKTESVIVFHRGSQLWQMDSFNDEFRFNTRKYRLISSDTIVVMNINTGKVIKSWGSNMFYLPHGLTLDSESNIWLTDVARHQVLKFSPKNIKEPVLEIGELMIPGNDRKHFCQPADVAVLKNGDFFVADGYCNSRIVKFNKHGEFLAEWSSEDEGMPSHFFVPHSIALNEQNNLICIADRENFRIQCFDLHGNLIHQISSPDFGPVYSVAFAANNASVLYALNGYNSRGGKQYDKKIFFISVKSGNVFATINLHPDIRTPHELELTDDASEIFIGNLNPPKIFKYALVNFNYTNGKMSKIGNMNSKSDPDKENFRTSLFIMGFLGIPLVFVTLLALIVRLKNMGKLNNVGSKFENRHKKIGKWLNKKANRKNGFTRLTQNSDDEEAESLNKLSHTDGQGAGDTESDSEVEINIPQLTKA